eukprot:jgi/Tetstr1/429597/TSEL_019496.t1
MEAGELPAGTSRSALRRKRRRSARARTAFAEAAEGGADAAADGVPPAVVDAHRRAGKLTAVQELRRARQAPDTADLGMVSDAAAALPVLEALDPPPAPTDPEYSPPEEPPDLRRAPPSWGGNADEVRRCHSRGGVFLASGTVFVLHKDDPAAREERAKTGEPLRVRPLGVGSVLTGFLTRVMPPSELDPFLEAVDAANISAAFSLLGAHGSGSGQRFAGQPTGSGGAAERPDLLELAQSGRVGAKSASAEDDYLAVPELLQRAESGYEAVRPVSRVHGLFPLSTDLTNEYLKQDDRRLPAEEEYLWMSCFGAHMAALFVALDELLPYDAFGSDELGQRTLDLLSSSLSAQELRRQTVSVRGVLPRL